MADRVQRFQPHDWTDGNGGSSMRTSLVGSYVDYLDYVKIAAELCDLNALHADLIDHGRKVQIAASGESKYGAMSDSEFIEWALGKLEGK